MLFTESFHSIDRYSVQIVHRQSPYFESLQRSHMLGQVYQNVILNVSAPQQDKNLESLADYLEHRPKELCSHTRGTRKVDVLQVRRSIGNSIRVKFPDAAVHVGYAKCFQAGKLLVGKHAVEVVLVAASYFELLQGVFVRDESAVEFGVTDEMSALKTLKVLKSTHQLDNVSAIQVLWCFQAPELVGVLLDYCAESFAYASEEDHTVYIETLYNSKHSFLLVKCKNIVLWHVPFEDRD